MLGLQGPTVGVFFQDSIEDAPEDEAHTVEEGRAKAPAAAMCDLQVPTVGGGYVQAPITDAADDEAHMAGGGGTGSRVQEQTKEIALGPRVRRSPRAKGFQYY